MKGERRVEVVADGKALAMAAAERVVRRISGADGVAAVCLTGGSTPRALYGLLATDPFRDRIPLSRVHWFWGDDRFVPFDDERNNARMAIDAMLAQVPAPAENIHRIPTDAPTAAEAARRYERELQRFYGAATLDAKRPLFDLVLMGLGEDGHTASLFPGDPALDETSRWVVGVEKAGLAPFVPRVTLTFPALASTREMLFLVAGTSKRDMLRRVLAGEDLPAARAWTEGEQIWLVEKSAT